MPKAMERSLLKTAEKRGYSKERTARYVFGAMQNRGLLKKKQPRVS